MADTTQDVLTHHDAQLVGIAVLILFGLFVATIAAWAAWDTFRQSDAYPGRVCRCGPCEAQGVADGEVRRVW